MARLSYCADQVRRLDHDRFLCSLYAPREQREALVALYAFNSEVARIPEAVNEPLLGRIRLEWWREAIDAVYAGRSPRHPVLEALAPAVARYGLGRGHFERLLAARALDLEEGAPADLADLVAYAEAASGSLTALAVQVLAGDDEGVRAAAREVGTAWALVGLMRAVPFHARMRRVYLPTALNRDAGLDVLGLFRQGPLPGLCRVVERVAEAARTHLAAARRHGVPRRAVPALLLATLADQDLRRLERAGFNPFDPRVRQSGAGRAFRLALNASRGRF